MKHSESIKEIATAMNKAQAEITAAKKDSKNPFFKSSYADLGSVIKAVKQQLAENGLSYMQAPEVSESMVGVTTIIMHTSGEWIESSLYLPMVKADPQAAGSAITYARRYALQSLMGLPAADDDAEFAMDRIKPLVGETTGKRLDANKIKKAYEYFKMMLDADRDEPEYDKIQTAHNRLDNDEQIEVMNMFGKSKPEGATRQYKNILADCLKMPLDENGQALREDAA